MTRICRIISFSEEGTAWKRIREVLEMYLIHPYIVPTRMGVMQVEENT